MPMTLAGRAPPAKDKASGEEPKRIKRPEHAAPEVKVSPKMDKEMKRLVTAMQKLLLKVAQESRDTQSVVFDTSIKEAARREVLASQEEARGYNNLTHGQAGHGHGPPHIWIFGAWLADVQEQLGEETDLDKQN